MFLARDPEENALGPDVVVAKAELLAKRQPQHLLRARRERELTGGVLLTGGDDPDDLGADTLKRDVERAQRPSGDAFLLTEQAEQKVLGADGVVPELTRLDLRSVNRSNKA